jgi:hypothetical protein
MSLFARTTPLDPTDPAVPLEAYKEGRKDERRQMDAGGLDHRVVKKELDEAFERGRRHGRLERRGSVFGVLSLLVLAVLLVAAAVMVFDYGSFGAAGSAIDRMTVSL